MDQRIYQPQFRARFWDKVTRGSADECWPWTGARYRDGYGYLWIERQKVSERAHRMAYAYAYGEPPDDLVVCHTCDNPPCCNAAHLFIGTRADNNIDRWRKGRNGHQAHGEANFSAKLTEAQVRAIVAAVETGESQVSVAARFEVKQQHVSRLVNRKAWAHLWRSND